MTLPPSSNIAICPNPFEDPARAKQDALALSQKYNLPLSEELDTPAPMTLGWVSLKKDPIPKLALHPKESGAVYIDFMGGKKAHRRQFGGGKGQPLIRAMGKLKEGALPSVIDATAGMGGDSFVIASQGFKVHMLERSVAVAALLEDAIQRGLTQANELADPELIKIMQNLTLTQGDSADYLSTQQPVVDVIYMDPMYPEKKKKAATKKEMKALQDLVGPDRDSERLLLAALNTARYRVVVKRPKGAPIIQCEQPGLVPSAEIASPNTRYDIYAIKALKASGALPA
ncbi:MAG: class I SAM-dependent methyltransferase [Gammaproteobacteria bacterium]|nr:class I SAM-dependent methyltransferase [Gammaproteobacteria bacterium]